MTASAAATSDSDLNTFADWLEGYSLLI